ncbi:MAG: toxic anion resistance protein, partial [Desulfobacteraceae bacterium IS3]
MNTTQTSQSLEIADPVKIRQELALVDPKSLTASNVSDPQIERQADEFVSAVLAFNPKDPVLLEIRDQHIAAAENLGVKTQREAAHRSAMLKEPIRKLAAKGEDGGEVANSLVSLKNQVEELDPGKFDLSPGWFTRALGWVPGIGTPLKNYFTKFESSQTVIDAIIHSLDDGKKMLQRDNVTLSQDQKAMRLTTLRLEKAVQLGILIDQKIAYALEREITAEDPRRRFIEDELLFPLRQRIQDLQQQLAVNQQGVLAVELIIRNNKELMKGVDRAVNVTVNALNVAVTVALALANQKIVLDKIEAVNKVTDHLIAQTAAQLRTQGVAVHKQASNAQLNIESLKKAFADINGALDDVSRFRQEALPRMASNILEMDNLTRTAEESIRRMEQGNKVEPVIF